MVVHIFWVINKVGGLIYDKKFHPGLAPLGVNAYLKLSGCFHAQHALARQLSPVGGDSGIEYIEAEDFKLFCYEAPTGVKFVLITGRQTQNINGKVDAVLRAIYELYADYVLKNHFYDMDQPIRVEKWETKLEALIEQAEL
eukprot:RCo048277